MVISSIRKLKFVKVNYFYVHRYSMLRMYVFHSQDIDITFLPDSKLSNNCDCIASFISGTWPSKTYFDVVLSV